MTRVRCAITVDIDRAADAVCFYINDREATGCEVYHRGDFEFSYDDTNKITSIVVKKASQYLDLDAISGKIYVKSEQI